MSVDASGCQLLFTAARTALVLRGVTFETGRGAGRRVATGYGEGYPVGTNATPPGRARNRRVELRRLPSGPAS
jgi:outer membrane protein OmpA-like peptidoglycan-associated protein